MSVTPTNAMYNVIDEAQWRQLAPEIVSAPGISFEGIEPLDQSIVMDKVIKFCDRLKASGTSIEDDAGVTILTIPEGLSINLAKNAFRYRFETIWTQITYGNGTEKVDRAYRIIITNNILSGTWNSDMDLGAIVEKAGCSLPKTLEAMVFGLLTKKRLSIQATHSKYLEGKHTEAKYLEGRYLTIGNSPSGLVVTSYDTDLPNIGAQGCERL